MPSFGNECLRNGVKAKEVQTGQTQNSLRGQIQTQKTKGKKLDTEGWGKQKQPFCLPIRLKEEEEEEENVPSQSSKNTLSCLLRTNSLSSSVCGLLGFACICMWNASIHTPNVFLMRVGASIGCPWVSISVSPHLPTLVTWQAKINSHSSAFGLEFGLYQQLSQAKVVASLFFPITRSNG